VVRESEPLCRRESSLAVRGEGETRRFGVGRESERSAENELNFLLLVDRAERAGVPAGSSQHISGIKVPSVFLGGRSILIRQRCLDEGVPGGSHPGTRPRGPTQKEDDSSRRFRLGVLGVLGG